MEYISKKVETPSQLLNRLEFFRLVEKEDENGNMVKIKESIGVHSKEQLLQDKEMTLIRLAEIEDKLKQFIDEK